MEPAWWKVSVEILNVAPGLEINARCSAAGNGGQQRRHIVAQQFPLLAIQSMPLIGGYGAANPGENCAHPFGMRIGQPLQEQGVHQGEGGGVCADAEGEREHDNDGESGALAQHAQSEAKVLQKLVEPQVTPHSARVFGDKRWVTKFDERCAASVIGSQAEGDVLLSFDFDVLANFLA